MWTHFKGSCASWNKNLLAAGMLLLLGSIGLVGAQPPEKSIDFQPPPGVPQAKIDEAIRRGVTFLANTQQPQGNWTASGDHGSSEYNVGYTAFPALTMLECGVSPSYAGVQAAAQYVRIKAPKLDKTYEVALAILFLDKLGDPRDVPIIQSLTLRLIAGQTCSGGWAYRCPILQPNEEAELGRALMILSPPLPPPLPPPPAAAKQAAGTTQPQPNQTPTASAPTLPVAPGILRRNCNPSRQS